MSEIVTSYALINQGYRTLSGFTVDASMCLYVKMHININIGIYDSNCKDKKEMCRVREEQIATLGSA